MLDQKGRIKIADFGLAKLLRQAPADHNLTGESQVMGTPHYMAPEQVERPLDVDHRADIYSLGVVFYEMLTGELPLGRFEPPSHKVSVSVQLDEVVLRALAKEPDRRYQHASDVRTDVEAIDAAGRGAPARSDLDDTGAIVEQAVQKTMTALGVGLRRGLRKRSSRTCWGLPLYDIALGPDPAKGEIRGHARGILAIGDIATGVLALGGLARGVVALGGGAIGLVFRRTDGLRWVRHRWAGAGRFGDRRRRHRRRRRRAGRHRRRGGRVLCLRRGRVRPIRLQRHGK